MELKNKNIKYNLFIGRYQTPHKGHQAIFEEYLKKGLPVLIAILDVEVNDENPLPPYVILSLWREIYINNPLVEVIVIPNIASVNNSIYMDYDLEEINIDEKPIKIYPSEIKNEILKGKDNWKKYFDEKIHTYLENSFKNIYGSNNK